MKTIGLVLPGKLVSDLDFTAGAKLVNSQAVACCWCFNIKTVALAVLAEKKVQVMSRTTRL
jgi:hypothetical protein